ILLRREGWKVNAKRVYRLYLQENLGVRTKARRKRAAHVRVPLAGATQVNERWSMDFMSDRLADGRAFRILTIVDQFSRECPLLEPGLSLTGTHSFPYRLGSSSRRNARLSQLLQTHF